MIKIIIVTIMLYGILVALVLEYKDIQIRELNEKLKQAYDLFQWIVDQWEIDTKEVQDKVVKFFNDNGGIDD